MAQIETPVPADRMAVFETREFPGRESTIDWALLLGSSEGRLEAGRVGLRLRQTEEVGRVRGMGRGRSRAAPGVVELGV